MRLEADTTPRATPAQAAKDKAYREAEYRLGHWVIALIGYEKSVPAPYPSNGLQWPVRVIATRDLKGYLHRQDLEQPQYELAVHGQVWVESEAHAKRLKTRLDGFLLGSREGDEGSALRHGWRDIPDPKRVWPLLLKAALIDIRRRERLDVLTDEKHHQLVRREALEGRFK
jgi:hypothetical protein